MVTAKPCTKCGETKPLGAFNRRRSGEEKRRAACRACEAKAARHRRDHPPLMSQIVNHYVDPTAPLSPEAGVVIYTSEPIDPKLLELREKRRKAAARRIKRLEREAKQNPMSRAARCYARMMRE